MAESIKWKVTEQDILQELVSGDNRWHISKKQTGKEPPQFYLTNYDLLLSPRGNGTNYLECFESFIADCNAYIAKVKEIRTEAQSHMAEMINLEKELAHAN